MSPPESLTALSLSPTTADENLHKALNKAQVMLTELEQVDDMISEPGAKDWLSKVESILLEQAQLIVETRRQLRKLAPDASLLNQLEKAER